jgi:predicted outer membrane repeat protein
MINGRKSGRSRGRRKICCGAAALASCLPLCLTAAEAGEYSEVSTHQTISEETHNTEKTRFAVTDKEQNRGGALLLEAPYVLAGGSVFEGNQAAESGGAVYADSKGRIRSEGPLTFSGNNARDGGAVYLEASGSNSSSNSLASGTSFTGNTGTGSGGALYISEGSYLTLYGGSSFTGNTAGEKGGAIYNSGNLVLDTTDGDITFKDNKAGGKGNDIHLGQSQSNAPLITITGTHSVTLTGGLTMDSTWYDADAFDGITPSVNDLASHTLITFSKENLQGNLSLGGSLTSGRYNKLFLAGGTTDIEKSFTLSEGSLLVLYSGALNIGGDFTVKSNTETVAVRKEISVSGKTTLPEDFGGLFADTKRLADELTIPGNEPVPSPDRDSVILHARGGIASSDGPDGTLGVRNYTLKLSGSGENSSGRIAMQNGALEISGVAMAIPSLEAVEENNVVSIVDGSAVTMGSLTAGAGTTILVGNETSSGSLTVGKLTLGDGVLTCDPDFSSGGTPSTGELSFVSGVDGTLNAGRNSIVGLGSGSLAAAQKGLADWETRTGGSFGGSVKAVLGISSPQTLTSAGAINVDGSFTSSSAPAVSGGEARFAGDSLLITDASTERDGSAALSGTGSSGSSLTVESGAKLYISGGRDGDTLTVTSAFPDTNVASDAWKGDNLTLDSALLTVTSAETQGDSYVVRLRAADTPLPDPAKDTAKDGIDTESPYPGVRFISRAYSRAYGAPGNATVEGAERLPVLGSVPQLTLAANRAAGSAVTERTSLASPGGDISSMTALSPDSRRTWSLWVLPLYQSINHYGLDAGSLDADTSGSLGGITVGADCTFDSTLRLGADLSVGGGWAEGSGDFNRTTNNMNFWGAGIYGGWTRGAFGLSADVHFTSSFNSLKQELPSAMRMADLEADITARALSAGIRAEYRLRAGNVTVIPHAGVRYTNLTVDGSTPIPEGLSSRATASARISCSSRRASPLRCPWKRRAAGASCPGPTSPWSPQPVISGPARMCAGPDSGKATACPPRTWIR